VTIAAQSASGLDQVVRLNVSWSIYTTLVDGLGEDNHARLTYDGEMLEIVSPGSKHEIVANLVSDLIAVAILEWSVDLTNFGSTPFRSEPRGFEADKAYYVDAVHRIRDLERIDLTIDPPPDLVVEIDIASDSERRLLIYAALGVAEVWRYKHDGLTFLARRGDAYVEIDCSQIIDGLPTIEVARRIAQRTDSDGSSVAILTDWQRWLRENQHLHATA
jgi:Uma2 family endonuclease